MPEARGDEPAPEPVPKAAIVAACPAFEGGCPYAKGATGNVASEDVLYLLNGLGIETGVDMAALVQAGQHICNVLGKTNGSRVARALLAREQA